jgi:hypothetical protein
MQLCFDMPGEISMDTEAASLITTGYGLSDE